MKVYYQEVRDLVPKVGSLLDIDAPPSWYNPIWISYTNHVTMDGHKGICRSGCMMRTLRMEVGPRMEVDPSCIYWISN